MYQLAERITITIPDQLHKRLQLVKDSLNVSGICQGAIERAVSVEEIKLQEIPKMTKVIERLKLEKQQEVGAWKEIGVIHSIEDATELSYNDFKSLESTKSISDEILTWIVQNHIQYLENPDQDAYLEGWLEGVLSFWDEVKDKLG